MNPSEETLEQWRQESTEQQPAAPRCASCRHFQVTPDFDRHGFCSLHGADIKRAELARCSGWQNVVEKLQRGIRDYAKSQSLRDDVHGDDLADDREAEREAWKQRAKKPRPGKRKGRR